MDPEAARSLLHFVEEVAPGLKGLDAHACLARIEERHVDLLAAMQCFIDTEWTDGALRLATSLSPFWTATKRLEMGRTWLDRALSMRGGEGANRGRALFDAGLLVFWIGDDKRARRLHDEALEIGGRIGNPTIAALALGGLARIALRTDLEEARRLCREALTVTEGTGDLLGRSSAVHVLAVAAQMAGDLHEARALMRERIDLGRELGNYAVVSSEYGNLSMVERQLGNLDEAEALARAALELDRQRGDQWAMPYKVSGIAAVAAQRGEHKRAATLLGVAEAMIEAGGASWPPDERVHYDWMVGTLTEAMGPAGFDHARRAGRSIRPLEAARFALELT